MIDYERFDAYLEGHFFHAMSRPPEEAHEIAQRRLVDESWRKAPESWINLVRWLAQKGRVSREDGSKLLLALVSRLSSEPIGPLAQRCLLPLVQMDHWKVFDSDWLVELIDWLAREAGPRNLSTI